VRSGDLTTRRSTICLVVAAVFVLAAVSADSMAASGEVPLTRDGGVYQVLATINGWLVRPFVVDSGAADVQVSADVFLTLYPRGTPSPRFLPGGSYGLADGRVIQSHRFVLRSLRIGGYEFPDVTASIGEPGAPLLLGQNVLARLGAWSIDNRRNVLVLGDRGGDRPDPGCLSWRTAPATCAVAAIRDHFRDLRQRHDVRSLVLLATDGEQATVLADVDRFDDRGTPLRLCGPIHVRRDGTSWRLAGPLALREIGERARCLP
jgi:hypothetical protein